MPSALDRAIDRAVADLVGPGGPMALGMAAAGARGPLPFIATAPDSLPAFFDHYCRVHGAKPFLVEGAEYLSFAEVHASARGLAARLVRDHGVRKGDRVGIAGRNGTGWVIAYMAALMTGGIATLLNGWWTGAELRDAIALADCRLVIADLPRADRIGAAGPVPLLRFDADWPAIEAFPVGVGDDVPLPRPEAEDDATLLFTSGSTARPRGVLSDHRAVVQATMSYATVAMAAARLRPPARHPPCALVTVPFFHVTAAVTLLLQSFVTARRLILMPRWDAGAALRLIEEERVTFFTGVPLMGHELATHPARADYDLSSLTDISGGGAAQPPAHLASITTALPQISPRIGYGLTESNACGSSNAGANYIAKPESVGRPSPPLMAVRIIDAAGAPLPAGTIGEVALRSVTLFKAYWRDPEATRAAFTAEGFFRTGDSGWLDEDGYLFLTGRAKEIVIRGGENIGCAEVEAALYAHPAIVEAAVFALPDPRLGEVPGAAISTRTPLTPEALRLFLAERIAPFKWPARLWIDSAPLPRLGSEKIDKQAARALCLARGVPLTR